jgi:diaminopimelate epimerase
VMIDGRGGLNFHANPELINRLCDRRLGIGGDGLIILQESSRYDFSMRYFNADGHESTMCGNGGRCITIFAKQLGLVRSETVFEGIDGKHSASILPDGEVRLKLVDVTGIERLEDGYLLDTGSPHFVKFVEEPEKIDVEHEGAAIRHQERFGPGGVNVNFVKTGPLPGTIVVRTFERGVERETWSCGTGATAAAIATGYHSGNGEVTSRVLTKGGELNVSFRKGGQEHFTDIYLTGPVSHVYDGTLEIVV